MLRTAQRSMLAAAATFATAVPALAGEGQPSPWEIGLQDSVTQVFDYAHWFHNYVLVIITVITLFVLGLLIYCIVRFNEKANPVPSKTTHHTLLEVAWTILPVLVLIVIAVPSFKLLFMQYAPPPADLTIKVLGRQWNWDVVYPDANQLTVTQVMLQDSELKPGQPRKLATDNVAVVPVNKVVRVEVTAEDVLHAFTIPSFGVKVDAIPGRLNETWFKATKEGVYYGQCSELCGLQHSGMPIVIQVVSDDLYKKWLEAAKTNIDDGKKVLEQASAAGSAAATVAAR